MDITNCRLEDCSASRYLNLKRLYYHQCGVCKSWDLLRTHNSVAILIYQRSRQSLVLVRQFRPPVYLTNGHGYTWELCAGLVDKDKPLATIAREEVWEETGYWVPVEALQEVTSFYTAVSFAGSRQHLFYVEVDDSHRQGDGGGIDSEQIEVIHLPVAEAKAFMWDQDRAKTPGLLFALQWFLAGTS